MNKKVCDLCGREIEGSDVCSECGSWMWREREKFIKRLKKQEGLR